MKGKTRKVAVIGAGMVGSSCAYSMVNQAVCDEILIIDRSSDRALAQALDLSHCMDFTHTRTKVYPGTCADCTDMDVVILTAGANPQPGQSRLTVLEATATIIQNVVQEVMDSGFQGIFVITSNPVDVVTCLVRQLSGFPRSKVIGTGTSIDSSRLKTLLSEVFAIDPRSVSGYALGEHGESQFVAWSHVTIGGKPILHILRQHQDRFAHVDLEDIERKTRDAGWEIFTRKGSTQFGIGNALAYITRSILNDDRKITAVSAVLEGEYGHSGLAIGVPAIIGGAGIQEVVELELTAEEQVKFNQSCNIIQQSLDQLSVV